MKHQASIEYLLLLGGVLLAVLSIGTVLTSTGSALLEQLKGASQPAVPLPVNNPPTVSVSLLSTSNLSVIIQVTASDDTGLSSLTIDWGDGNTESHSISGRSFVYPYGHSYPSAGYYTIKVTVSDNYGATASSTLSVNVSAPMDTLPPEISSFTADPPTILEGESTTLTCSAADEFSGISVIKIYKDSGDDTPVKTCTTPTCSVTVTYSVAGTYYPRCVAIDVAGNSAEKSTTVYVKEKVSLLVEVIPSNKYPDPGTTIYISCHAYDNNGIAFLKIYRDINSYSWIGKQYDGQTEVRYSASFTYYNEGIYKPVCEVENTLGETNRAITEIFVGVDDNKELCLASGLIWCPDCTWGQNGKVYSSLYPAFTEDANCVGDGSHLAEVVENIKVLYNNTLVLVSKVVRPVKRYDLCLLRDDGNYFWVSGGQSVEEGPGYPRWFCYSYNYWVGGDYVETNEYLCNLRWMWCPDCLWGDDKKIHVSVGDGDLKGYCVGNEGDYLDENTNVIFASGKAGIYKVARLDSSSNCVYVYDKTQQKKVYTVPNGTIMTLVGDINCECKLGRWICSNKDENEEFCIVSGGIWCPDCSWGSDGKIYGNYNASLLQFTYDERNCAEYGHGIAKTVEALNLFTKELIDLKNVPYINPNSDKCLFINKDGHYYWVPVGYTIVLDEQDNISAICLADGWSIG